MKRHSITPRHNWQKIVEDQGFPFHTSGVRPADGSGSGTYWAEDAYYEFSLAEIEQIEAATEELQRISLAAVNYVCGRPDLMQKLAIPERFHDFVKRSWSRRDPHVYGRFDLGYDGKSPPKLLENNADTPTTLIESSVIQWHWLEQVYGGSTGGSLDQFNSIHEKLIARCGALAPLMTKGTPLYFLAIKDNLEEFATVEYLRDVAMQGGCLTEFLYLQDLGWHPPKRRFTDLQEMPIDYAFKLYPWEWMIREEFAPNLLESDECTGWIEPPWKAILSNKGILPILWEMFPGHPNLLPAYWGEHPGLGGEYITKPILGREGANMKVVSTDPARRMETAGEYGTEPKIFQKLFRLPQVDGRHFMTIGSWETSLQGCVSARIHSPSSSTQAGLSRMCSSTSTNEKVRPSHLQPAASRSRFLHSVCGILGGWKY
ncbi:MAG: glutathionylspermidine synthase family protein [Patescibacteria group bacterium]